MLNIVLGPGPLRLLALCFTPVRYNEPMLRLVVVLAVALGPVVARADDHTKVTIYNRHNFGNDIGAEAGFRAQVFGEGRYNIDQLGDVGNDATESVFVSKGWRIQLFEHADFKGRSITLDESRTDLGDFARLTSSIIVTHVGVPTVAAKRGRRCSGEGERCTFLGPATLYYGVADAWVETKRSGPSAPCSSFEYGDPKIGSKKECFVADEPAPLPTKEGRKCVDEGGTCGFGPATIYYGAGDRWIAWRYDVSVTCTAENLGDPNPGVAKSCYVAGEQPPLKAHPTTGGTCADEGGVCKSLGHLGGERLWPGYFYFGAGDAWVKIDPPVGLIKCAPESFGGDPAPGIKKVCFVARE